MKVKRAVNSLLETREEMIQRALALVLSGIDPLDLPSDLRTVLRGRAEEEVRKWGVLAGQLSLFPEDGDENV